MPSSQTVFFLNQMHAPVLMPAMTPTAHLPHAHRTAAPGPAPLTAQTMSAVTVATAHHQTSAWMETVMERSFLAPSLPVVSQRMRPPLPLPSRRLARTSWHLPPSPLLPQQNPTLQTWDCLLFLVPLFLWMGPSLTAWVASLIRSGVFLPSSSLPTTSCNTTTLPIRHHTSTTIVLRVTPAQ